MDPAVAVAVAAVVVVVAAFVAAVVAAAIAASVDGTVAIAGCSSPTVADAATVQPAAAA